jgi:hypothetical protein
LVAPAALTQQQVQIRKKISDAIIIKILNKKGLKNKNSPRIGH